MIAAADGGGDGCMMTLSSDLLFVIAFLWVLEVEIATLEFWVCYCMCYVNDTALLGWVMNAVSAFAALFTTILSVREISQKKNQYTNSEISKDTRSLVGK